jgi:hypothetical protein
MIRASSNFPMLFDDGHMDNVVVVLASNMSISKSSNRQVRESDVTPLP